MALPDLLLVGAQKAGTTSLHHYLGQHPRLAFAAVKEPGYFSWPDEKHAAGPAGRPPAAPDLRAYRALFHEVAGLRERGGPGVIGEASTAYLYAPGAAARARELLPAAKIVVLLRQPAERAFSNWLHARREGREPLADFLGALDAEDARVEALWGPMWHYRRKSLYAPQLERWQRHFPGQVWVGTTDELAADPEGVCAAIFGFLGLDASFVPDCSARLHVGASPRGPAAETRLHRAMVAMGARVPMAFRHAVRDQLFPRQELDAALRRELTARWFEEDLAATGPLIGRDLTGWLR